MSDDDQTLDELQRSDREPLYLEWPPPEAGPYRLTAEGIAAANARVHDDLVRAQRRFVLLAVGIVLGAVLVGGGIGAVIMAGVAR